MSVDLLYGRRDDTGRAGVPFLGQQGINNEEYFEDDEVVLVRGIIGDRDVDMTEDLEEFDSMSVAAEANGRSSFKTTSDSSSSFSDLEFIAGVDKGKRRSDRYDSSESSDSGLATLSPSTSDSPELISPYSPCDFSSEPSDVSSCVSGSPLSSTSPTRDVASFLPEVEQSSSSSSLYSSSSVSSAMTAVSSVLDVSQMTSNTSKINVTNFISFQIPKAQSSPTRFAAAAASASSGAASNNNSIKILEPSNSSKRGSTKGGQNGHHHHNAKNRSPYTCDSSPSKKIHNIFAALKYKPDEVSGNSMPDLTQAEFQPVVKVPNLRGAKSFILHEGQRNKVIILSVPQSPASTASPNKKSINNNNTSSKNKNKNNTTTKTTIKNEDDNDEEDSQTSHPVRKKPRIDPGNIPVPISLTTSTILESKPQLLPDSLNPLFYSGGPKKTDNSIEVSQRVTGTELLCPLPLSQSLPPNNNNNIIKNNNHRHHHHNNNNNHHHPPPFLESSELESKSSSPESLLLPTLSSSSPSSSSFSSSSSSNAPHLHPHHSISSSEDDDDRSSSSSKVSINSSSSSCSSSSQLLPSSSSSSLVGQIFLTLSNNTPRAQQNSSGSSCSNSGTPPPSNLPFFSSSSSCSSTSSATSSSSSSFGSSSSAASSAATSSEVSRKRKQQQQNNNNISIESSATTTSTTSILSTIRSSSSSSSSSSEASSNTEFRSILSLSASSCTKNSQNNNNNFSSPFTTKRNDRLITHAPTKCEPAGPLCLWKDCPSASDANLNILEHIQTVHVAPQLNKEAYICLWEGCKVFNKKSCSFSWLERHVLSHGGNKPFKCIIPGCGLSFSSQGTLERHVNSHISNNGPNGTNGTGTLTNRKLDSSPSKAARRKKQKNRKQRHNIGQHVDYFDKHTMEVIKYRLASAVCLEEVNQHDCKFHSEILGRRVSANEEEPHLLVRWFPFDVFPDEWIPQSKYKATKVVPFRRIPRSKIRILYPKMFPPERKEKAQRKWKPRTALSSSSSASSSSSSSTSSSLMSSSSSEASSPMSSVDSSSSRDLATCDCPEASSDTESAEIPDWVHYLAQAYAS